eukprot:GHRR01026147.1.p3 GENE.GHRR01026147.1~~GHRR01026147.1.p3  ORF type:complete len:101 (+),score=18.07 GHRR01026147.1:229-531(+)
MSSIVRSGPGAALNKSASITETLSHKSVVEKQRAAIEKLRQQNAKLKEDLLLENKFSIRPSNPSATVLINKLQDEADLYTRKVSTQLVLAGQLQWWRVHN